jgi:aminopeptidase N
MAWIVGARAEAQSNVASTPGKLPKHVAPVAYRIDLTPDAAAARFTGRVEIDVDVLQAADTIVLNASGLTLDSVSVQDVGAPAAVTLDSAAETATLRFARPLSAGRHTIEIAYVGRIGAGRSGLFHVDYDAPSGRQRMLATQFEFSAARRMVPCWDEPAFKATFALSATLPEGITVLSNTPVAREAPAPVSADGAPRRRVSFLPTPRMSSYLLVLAAGELEAVRDTVNGLPLGAWTVSGRAARARTALADTRQLLPLFEAYFGVPYSLPKLDLIAVPGLGFDAMENWGAIILNDDAVLLDAATTSDASRQSQFHLVAHEVAHQWIGNLATTASWVDVWLNESLAEWMAYEAAERLHPEWQAWLRAHAAKRRALANDAGPNPRAIIGRGFDATTAYRKGPAVIRMLASYIGEDAFREGVRRFVRSHAYSNATTTDLWTALGQASGRDVAAVAQAFVERGGVPLVRVETRCERGTTVATLTQRRFTMNSTDDSAGVWRVPVVVAPVGGQSAGAPPEARTVLVDSAPSVVRFPGCRRPVKANLGDVGYYRTEYDAETLGALTARYSTLASADRIGLFEDQWALVQAGRAHVAAYLKLTRRLDNEREPAVWTEALEVLRQIDVLLRGSSAREKFATFARTLLQPALRRVGWDPRPGESSSIALLRGELVAASSLFADSEVVTEARRRLAAHIDGRVPLPPSLRDAVLEAVGRHADRAMYDTLLALARGATDWETRRGYYWALASAQDSTLIDRTVALALTGEITGFNLGMLLVTAARRGDADRVWRDVRAQRDTIVQRVGGGGGILQAIAEHSTSLAVAVELRTDQAFASAAAPPNAAGAIAVRAELRSRVVPAVAEWLRRSAGPRSVARPALSSFAHGHRLPARTAPASQSARRN